MDVSVERVLSTGDRLVADAARASFDRQAKDYSDEANAGLINFLAKHEPPHWTPFGHVRITIAVPAVELFEVVQDPTLCAGMSIKNTAGGTHVTHSLWGWKRLLESKVFSDRTVQGIRQTLNTFDSMKHSLLALGLDEEYSAPVVPAWRSMEDITLRIRCPIVIARQLFKHTVGFVYSEASGRYISYTTVNRPWEWCNAPDNKKQGAGDPVGFVRHCLSELILGASHTVSRTAYWLLRKALRVAPEQARFVMPMAVDTTFVVTGSHQAWSRLLTHRLDSAAQQEIRVLAEHINCALGVDFHDHPAN